ncbi:hypothetical protein [Pseudonocardia sp. N23]|uniref:hypothetical protein n=1 Tax=Pseudonocardia sp. N23 TaxID=1987376 RepID=UPI001C0ED96E|nr:hypothetical protein [Pseudonocardia sp. N23]
MTPRVVLRAGLLVLGVTQAVVGLWALPAPRSFYDGFPAPGHHWVSALPPYNEHLVRDVGALSLALTVLLVAAAVWLDRRLVAITLVVFAVWTVPHVVFHSVHLHGFSVLDATAQTVGFAVEVVVAAVLAVVLVRSKAPAVHSSE